MKRADVKTQSNEKYIQLYEQFIWIQKKIVTWFLLSYLYIKDRTHAQNIGRFLFEFK